MARPNPKAPPATPCTDDAEAGGCQITDLFKLLSRAHMMDVLYVLTREADGPMRFVDVQNRLNLSPNTLSERLKELVGAGLLTRTAYNEIPPRVDYEATDKARALGSVFQTLREWAREYDLQPAAAVTDSKAATA